MSSAPPFQPMEMPSGAVFLSYASQDAEASLDDSEPIEGKALAAGQAQWRHCAAIGRVTEEALWLRVTVGGERGRPQPLEAYVDNIRLRLAE